MLRRFLEEILLGADRCDERCDQFLADRVERRVRDLREKLLEVAVQELGPRRQDRQRRIGAHRAGRFEALRRHRGHEDPQVFERVAEELLALAQSAKIGLALVLRRRQVLQLDQVVVQPAAVRLARAYLGLDLLVIHDPALVRVHEQHAARLKPPLVEDVLRIDLERAGLGRHDDEAVLGDGVARWPEAVAVEHRADALAVGERDRRGAVPRLHDARVVFVERPLLVAHGLVVLPRFRDEHHDRVGQGAARVVEELDGVVEHRGVARAGDQDREEARHVRAEQVGLEQALARVHPVDVSVQRVDLAVVAEEAERLGEVPRRERVRAVALVDEREAADELRVGQVRVERLDLVRDEEPLVDHRAARQARHVERALLRHVRIAHGLLHDLADGKQPAFEILVVLDARAAADEDLLHHRFRLAGDRADDPVVDAQIAPAEQRLTFLPDDVLEHRHAPPGLFGILRQEHQARAVLEMARQLDPDLPAFAHEEIVRDLHEDAGAVTGLLVASARAAVGEIDEDLERLVDDVVGFDALEVADEAHAAGVALVARVVQSLRAGDQCRVVLLSVHDAWR